MGKISHPQARTFLSRYDHVLAHHEQPGAVLGCNHYFLLASSFLTLTTSIIFPHQRSPGPLLNNNPDNDSETNHNFDHSYDTNIISIHHPSEITTNYILLETENSLETLTIYKKPKPPLPLVMHHDRTLRINVFFLLPL